MRTKALIVTTALLLATAAANAQQPAQPQAPAFQPQGWVDFGARGTDITGDPARFQRYRDLGDGAFLETFRWNFDQDGWYLNLGADKVGRKDQRYFGEAQRPGKLSVSFMWDQIPLLMSRDTATLYRIEAPGVLRIDDAIQQGIEAGRFTLSSVVGQGSAFETRNQRDWAAFNAVFTPTRDVDLKIAVRSAKREGNMPWGASFGFNHAVEVAAPIDTRTTDVGASAEWANQRGLVRLAYDGSWFDNNIQALVWDNPLKFTDSTHSRAYVGGDGTSQGRAALWPSNTVHTVSGTGSVKIGGRSRVTGYVAVGFADQNQPLLPATINTAVERIPLARSTAEAEARTVSTNLSFTSRPNQYVWLNARYRYYDFDNRTPLFPVEHYVRLDQVIEELAAEGPEYFDIRRQNFDAEAAFSPFAFTSFKVGYGRGITDRTFRIFEQTTEDTLRLTGDYTGNQYVTLRTQYEYSTREGDHFDLHALEIVGEQPGMRHYDVADRDRNRVTAIVSVFPVAELGVSASIGAGKDDYKNSEFGLLDNEHRVYSIGFDVLPRDEVLFSLNYEYENYMSLQNSRQASPGPQFVDPSRDWSIDADDKVHTVAAGLDLMKLLPRTEVRFGYDYSRAKSIYLYGAGAVPRTLPDFSIVESALLGAIEQLPPVTSELQTGTIDTRYFLTEKVAIGFVYWYDRFRVEDFALGNERILANDLPGGYLLGYLYRPYTAHSGWARLSVYW